MRGRTKDTDVEYFDSAPQKWPDMPLVLLVDEGSASASEIVAGALQDHDRALLVGRSTFGKGSAQTLFPTSTGGALKLTIARWFTPVGRSIDRPRRQTVNGDGATDKSTPESFRTSHGRTVYGGGGITPDVLAGDTVLAPSAQAFETALGSRIPDFGDALTAYAISLKTAGKVTSPDFEVTPAMRDGLWATLKARGINVSRSVYDGASDIVSQLLAREIARYVFGPAAETQRAIGDDEVIGKAVTLLRGVTTTEALLKRATAK
jgi:carboxyl-terminal processing protease